MAIIQRLKVYSPITQDGITVVMKKAQDGGLFPVERISYVAVTAKSEIDRLNAKRKSQLKERYEVVNWDTKLNREVGSDAVASRKVDTEKADLLAKLAEAEAKLKALEAEKESAKEPKKSSKAAE